MAHRRANGEGHFEYLEDGRYRLRRQVNVEEGGKRIVLTATADTRQDCLKIMQKKEREWRRHQEDLEAVYKDTVTMLCTRHLNEQISQKYRLKPKSMDRRESTIRNQIEPYALGGMQICTVTGKDIEKHIEHLIKNTSLSVSTIDKTLDVINAAYKWAITQGYIENNPCTAVMDKLSKRLENLENRRSIDADVIVLSDEEIERFTAVALTRNANNGKYKYSSGIYALFLLNTGMRCGELCCLRWGDYHRESGSISIDKTRYVSYHRLDGTKTGYTPGEDIVKNAHAREIKLTKEAKEILDEIYEISEKRGDSDYVLLNDSGKPSNPTNLGSCVRTIFRKAGLPEEISGLHVFRRTFATKMYDSGATIKDIAAYLGDLESTVSKHYISVRKRVKVGGITRNIVPVPEPKLRSAGLAGH